jgi:hypothetical protein
LLEEVPKGEKNEVLDILRRQLQTEGELVGLYEGHERETENLAMKRLMQMYRLDSQRHINILQAAIEIIEGEEVYIENKKTLARTLKKHLELEEEALKTANKILNKVWIDENKGLKGLLQFWRDDEKRHHAGLKKLTSKIYFRIDSRDMVVLFRDEDFLEERYRRSKAFREKDKRARQ